MFVYQHVRGHAAVLIIDNLFSQLSYNKQKRPIFRQDRQNEKYLRYCICKEIFFEKALLLQFLQQELTTVRCMVRLYLVSRVGQYGKRTIFCAKNSIVTLDKTHTADLFRKYRKKRNCKPSSKIYLNIENCIETHFRQNFGGEGLAAAAKWRWRPVLTSRANP